MNGQNVVNDDPKDVIEAIENDLDAALKDLGSAEQTIERTQRKLAILKERDDMQGGL